MIQYTTQTVDELGEIAHWANPVDAGISPPLRVNSYACAAMEGAECLAFALVEVHDSDLHIRYAHVRKDQQRTGLCKELIRRLLGWNPQMTVRAESTSTFVDKMLENLGFVAEFANHPGVSESSRAEAASLGFFQAPVWIRRPSELIQQE